MPRSKGRAGRPWRRAAATIRARVRDLGAPCCLCGHAIDLALHHNHPLAFTVEHLDPLSLGGAPRDLDRLAPAHRSCNSRRGNRVDAPALVPTSRAW